MKFLKFFIFIIFSLLLVEYAGAGPPGPPGLVVGSNLFAKVASVSAIVCSGLWIITRKGS